MLLFINFHQGLSKNGSLQNLSFARSALSNEGCQIICLTVKHMQNIEHVNFSACELSLKGAEAICDLLKVSIFSLF